MYLGIITKVRDHATHPLEVEIDLGDGALEPGWIMCSLGAWASSVFDQLQPGTQVTVLDTGYTDSPDKYRVTDIWPSFDLPLEPNRKRIARRGDAVGIRGNTQITPLAAATILTGLPLILPLGHDHYGVITDD